MSARNVPFVRPPAAAGSVAARAGGPEAVGAAAPAEAPATTAQKARAADLFLRGALTPEQLDAARASRGGFEVVIGKNDFLPAVFLEVGVATARCTCLVRASGVDFRGDSGSWSGTGFLIGPNVLVTNHHVLNAPAVASAGSAVFDFQLGADGRPKATRTFRLRPDRLFLTSPIGTGLDYTFVWVDGEPGREFGTVRVSRGAFRIAEKEEANVVSHPDGRMKEIAIRENTVQWQDEVVVHYTSDTEPGSSGASVCNNTWQLVALHHASQDSQVPGFRLLNEGIKLSAIAADLERLTRDGSAAARELLALFGGTDERLGFFGTLGRRPVGGAAGGAESVTDTYKGTEQDLDVGFWNVEWLTRRYEQKAAAVAKVLSQMNLDVWCLEESSPAGARAVADELRTTYGLDFKVLDAEPHAAEGLQTCSVLFNANTVDVRPEAWGEPIETWLKADSRAFDDLDLPGPEAVHGRVFDRYPALFKVKGTHPAPGGAAAEFYLVPLHLKAKDEGGLRRQMASKILAAAVKKKIGAGAGPDWVIGGDYNAALATDDFAALVGGGMVPLSAEDAAGGAFSYIKGPRSLIDHIFVSPNLAARYGAGDYFVVAAERTFPDYVRDISDHRPVVFRMSLGHPEAVAAPDPASVGKGKGKRANGKPDKNPVMDELIGLLKPAAGGPESVGAEARPARPPAGRSLGYAADFLGGGAKVPLPGLPADLAAVAAVVDPAKAGTDRFVLAYTHFSVVMNAGRRMPFYSAVNIDGTQLLRIPRQNTNWLLDPRIPAAAQVGNEVYRGNDLDKGHMTRRLDPVWGPRPTAARADADTFHYTNACPQHKDLNQREWSELEDYVLDNAGAEDLKVCVFTGPVFGPDDKEYRGVLLPNEFWKVVVIRKGASAALSATGYVLSQRDMIRGLEFAFGRFKTYQVKVGRIEQMTGLQFGALVGADPLVRGGPEAVGPESARAGTREVTGPEDIVF